MGSSPSCVQGDLAEVAWADVLMEMLVVLQPLSGATELHHCLALLVGHNMHALGGVPRSTIADLHQTYEYEDE